MPSLSRKSKAIAVYPAVLSFGITLLRCFIALLVFSAIASEPYSSVMKNSIYIFLIMILDQLDGDLFRISSLNNQGYWRRRRRLIDSCADRFCIQIVCLPLVFGNPDFLYLYLAITFKEIMNSIPCISAFVKFRALLRPRFFSKLSTVLVGLVVIVYINGFPTLAHVLTFAMMLCSFISIMDYQQQNPSEIDS